MKKIFALILVVLFTQISFAQQTISGSLSVSTTGLVYDNSTGQTALQSGSLYVGQYPYGNGNKFNYVLCVIDLSQQFGYTGRVISAVTAQPWQSKFSFVMVGP